MMRKYILLTTLSAGLLFSACTNKNEDKKVETNNNSNATATTAPTNSNSATSTQFPFGEDGKPVAIDSTQIKKTATGLQYVLIQEGSGNVPQAGQKVMAQYHGTLPNGNKFDSSYDRGQPFEFEVGRGQVIKGWDEAFTMFKVGTKAILIIPPGLGYGERNMGNIPPNSTLIFHVELLGIQ